MHVTTDVQTMKKALATIKPGIARRGGVMPALYGARFEAKDGRLTITATDLDLTVSTGVTADVIADGVTVIPHAELTKLLKGKGPLDLAANDGQVSIKNGSLSTLRTLVAEEYPAMLEGPGPDSAGIPLDLDSLGAVLAAASKDQARPILASVYFKGPDMVATDSYRLHRVTDPSKDYPELLIPALSLVPVVKHGQPATMHVVAGRHEPEVVIASGPVTWRSRLIEGEFPNYEQLMPEKIPYTLTVDRDAMVAALGPIKAFLAKSDGPVRLKLTDGSSHLELLATVQDVGECGGSVDLPGPWSAGDITLAFNPGFLLDAITVGEPGPITLGFTDTLKPALLTENAYGRTLDRLIMPARVA